MRILRWAVPATAVIFVSSAALLTGCATRSGDQATGAKPGQVKSGEQQTVWGEPVEGQAVSIATDKRVYAPGDRIVLKIRLKNVGRGVVTEARDRYQGVTFLYSVRVLLPNGKSVPLTPIGAREAKREAEREAGVIVGSGTTRKISPGGEIRDDVNLTEFFDTSSPGKYVVSAKRKVLTPGIKWSPTEALSNKLEITVAGRPGNTAAERLGRGSKARGDQGEGRKIEAWTWDYHYGRLQRRRQFRRQPIDRLGQHRRRNAFDRQPRRHALQRG